jgi:hypothetical protein
VRDQKTGWGRAGRKCVVGHPRTQRPQKEIEGEVAARAGHARERAVDRGVARRRHRECPQHRPVALDLEQRRAHEASERTVCRAATRGGPTQGPRDPTGASLQIPALRGGQQCAFVREAPIDRPDRDARARRDRPHRGALQAALADDGFHRRDQPLASFQAPMLPRASRLGRAPQRQRSRSGGPGTDGAQDSGLPAPEPWWRRLVPAAGEGRRAGAGRPDGAEVGLELGVGSAGSGCIRCGVATADGGGVIAIRGHARM